MNGDEEQRSVFLARFSSTEIAVAGMIGAVILVVLLIVAGTIT
jgi:hypothetical protein